MVSLVVGKCMNVKDPPYGSSMHDIFHMASDGPLVKENDVKFLFLEDNTHDLKYVYGAKMWSKNLFQQLIMNDHDVENLEKIVKLNGYFVRKCNKVHGLQQYSYQVGAELFKRVKSIVNKRHSNVPFDPGGTSLKPGETTRKVKLFRRVVKIINMNRVDVPFDPGGFGLKTKLEDEFFRRRGVRCRSIRPSILTRTRTSGRPVNGDFFG
ncbi:hypothetical protein Hanom_Chr06g00579391 [Helianthus anomalus]